MSTLLIPTNDDLRMVLNRTNHCEEFQNTEASGSESGSSVQKTFRRPSIVCASRSTSRDCSPRSSKADHSITSWSTVAKSLGNYSGSCRGSLAARRRHPACTQQDDRDVVTGFYKTFLRLEPNLTRVWRNLLDKQCKGFLTCQDFSEVCRSLGFREGVREVWSRFDADSLGKITFCEFHWQSAETLGVFYTAIVEKFGDVHRAAVRFGMAGGRRLPLKQFIRIAREEGLAAENEAEMYFEMLCSSASATPMFSLTDISWLGQLGPSLPKPVESRAQPGFLTREDLALEFDDGTPPCCSDLGRCPSPANRGDDGGLVDLDQIFDGDSCLAPELCTSSSEEEDVYEKLYKHALVRRERLRATAETCVSAGGQRPPPRVAPEIFVRLHADADLRKASRENAEEGRFLELCPKPPHKTQHSEESFERLTRPRKNVTPDVPEVPVKQNSHEGGQRAMRLYEESKRRLERQTQRRILAEMMEETKLQSMRQSAPVAHKSDHDRLVQRLYTFEVARRRKKELHAQQQQEDLERCENEQRKTAAIAPNLEVFDKLYFEAAAKKRSLSQKRAEIDQYEKLRLRGESIHRNVCVRSDDDVFERLHISYNRHKKCNIEDNKLDDPLSTDSEEDEETFVPRPMFEPEPQWVPPLMGKQAGVGLDSTVNCTAGFATVKADSAPNGSSASNRCMRRARSARSSPDNEESLAIRLARHAELKTHKLEKSLAELQAKNRELICTGRRHCEEKPAHRFVARPVPRSRSSQSQNDTSSRGQRKASHYKDSRDAVNSTGDSPMDSPMEPRQPPQPMETPPANHNRSLMVEFLHSVGKTQTASLLEKHGNNINDHKL